MQQVLKPAARAAGTEVTAPDLLEEFLVAMRDAIAASDTRFAGNLRRRLLVRSKRVEGVEIQIPVRCHTGLRFEGPGA